MDKEQDGAEASVTTSAERVLRRSLQALFLEALFNDTINVINVLCQEPRTKKNEGLRLPKFGIRLWQLGAIHSYEPPCSPDVGPLNMRVAVALASYIFRQALWLLLV